MTIRTEAETIRILKQDLFTAVVGDILDVLGYRKQFLPPGLAPLQPGARIAGRAMPVLEADVFGTGLDTSAGPLAHKPFGLMLEALDDLKEGEIYIATGASLNYAIWGGLMSTRATHLKAAGAVLDGYVRDVGEILALGFPVFCRGVYAQDQGPRGKVIDYRTTIEIGGVIISPGDLVYGDDEGVLIIPTSIVDKVVTQALEKVRTENQVASAIKNGMSATEAFSTFGVM
ncbi:RraA family protein [Devosia naphthalenivorans]|uniref:RraA family protein n=1 Tax=Devosia naphthalenivorans TaxID=2082392 RepID=UPI000D39F129|nr:RraA family protein [Devosia naphthalenivorans]